MGPELQKCYLPILIFCIILRLNSYFSQNILTRSNEVVWDALHRKKTVRTKFQPEKLKERNHLENERESGKTMFKCYLKEIG